MCLYHHEHSITNNMRGQKETPWNKTSVYQTLNNCIMPHIICCHVLCNASLMTSSLWPTSESECSHKGWGSSELMWASGKSSLWNGSHECAVSGWSSMRKKKKNWQKLPGNRIHRSGKVLRQLQLHSHVINRGAVESRQHLWNRHFLPRLKIRESLI